MHIKKQRIFENTAVQTNVSNKKHIFSQNPFCATEANK